MPDLRRSRCGVRGCLVTGGEGGLRAGLLAEIQHNRQDQVTGEATCNLSYFICLQPP